METTINMQMEILEQITRAAKSSGITRTALIIILLKKVMADTNNPDCLWNMVKYQDSRLPNEWHKFHIVLRPDDYEYFLDLRKLLKMSVSLILGYAVDKYLCKLKKKKLTDNYPFKNYVIIKKFINSIPCWELIWGYPPDLGKYIEKLC